MWSTAGPQNPESEMVEVGEAKSYTFYQADFAVHAFDKATGYSMDEKTDNFRFPISQGIAEAIHSCRIQQGRIG